MRSLNLLVLRCRDIEASRGFYECIGLTFERHRHGSGPEHFAHEDEVGVIELYPISEHREPDTAGLGFRAADLARTAAKLRAGGHDPGPVSEQPWGTSFVVRDPDGRRVEISVG